jgi:hypothetical protein
MNGELRLFASTQPPPKKTNGIAYFNRRTADDFLAMRIAFL